MKMTVENIRMAKQRYNDLSEEEFQRYLDIGKAGTLAHRAGGRSFGPRSKGKAKAKAKSRAQILPGDVADNGAFVLPDAAEAFQGSVAAFNLESFGERYDRFRASLKPQPDALALSQEEAATLTASEENVANTPVAWLVDKGFLNLGEACKRRVFPHGSARMTGLKFQLPAVAAAKARVAKFA